LKITESLAGIDEIGLGAEGLLGSLSKTGFPLNYFTPHKMKRGYEIPFPYNLTNS
jgi:hypothetical protein